MKKRVLFLCETNAARSQMAEAFVSKYYGDQFEAFSGGHQPGHLSQYAVDVMAELGVDISHNETKKAFKFFQDGKTYHYVITIWDEKTDPNKPVFPGVTQRVYWSFDDIAEHEGDHEQKLHKMRGIRDAIKSKIDSWATNPHEEDYRDPIALKNH